MIEKQSGGNAPKYGPKGLGGAIAKTVYSAVKNQGGPRTKVAPKVQVGNPEKITGSRGKPVPTVTGNPDGMTGKLKPKYALSDKQAREVEGRRVMDALSPKPNVSKAKDAANNKDVVKPGARPVKPAPSAPKAPSVYRAKKGDGLWQVAEKTKPAGVSTAAWWTKIKKLNSTNGKVNRTYTGTGVKLPKA